ncbi:putative T7SS-secreted protein [Streptomyces sp. H27-D2]|uniref:putative T7SS-secreted protein n=1 Tax=Streptomyces sp. H27-D2 TaxID=3046304 RepID=UPI002DBC730E|nr:DUF6531 domain-containing protein [Streptomyces sp. H27-D2]MEC4014877.1 DUF6531 domain-containing protein [Streptomyces sp. H27-D2]
MGWDLIPDVVEDTVEDGVEKLGEGVDWAGDQTADGLDNVGLGGGADWVREKSDSAANYLGADVAEMELGRTENPKKLIYGSVARIKSTTSHLKDFQKSFDQVGRGLKGVDSSRWKGQAADAFREKVAVEPKKWFKAADAFEKASDAMERFSETLAWAQQQAQEAIDAYKKAQEASEKARAAHNAAVAEYNTSAESYNASAAEGKEPGTKPVKPGEFSDPGTAGLKAAQGTLDEARRQRDEAAESARKAVRSARDAAPDKPSYGEQFEDGLTGLQLSGNHIVGGVVKGTAGMVGFARSVNPIDPYNLTHPAEYATSLNSTVTGLVTMVNDPVTAGKTMLSGFARDPGEGIGKFLPELFGSKGLGSARRLADAARHLPEGHKPPKSPGRAGANEGGPGAQDRQDCKRTCGGTDPVDLSTGKMYLPQTDVALPGALPLVFSRRVESGYAAGRWFGPSWSSTADQRLEIDAEGVVLISEDGLLLAYPHPAPDVPTLPETGPRWPLERDANGDYTLSDPDTGHVRHFTGPSGAEGNGADGIARLEQISDRNGHWITFEYDPESDPEGAPTGIVHSCGYHLKLSTANGRITALHLTGGASDGSDQELIRYDYSADGDLTEVINSSGLPLRFEYDDEHRVISWTDTNDRRYDYVYDNRDRCVAEGGTEGHISVRIDYDSTDPATGHRVTNVTTTAGGHTTRYLFNALRQVVAVTDPLGNTVRTEHDRYDRLLSRTDALGRTTAFAYDADGRLSTVTRPDGHESTAAYDSLGHPTTITEVDGSVWQQEYDERGNHTAVTDPAGHTTRYAYNDHGHLTTVTNALAETLHVHCDPAGLPLRITDPLGATTTYTRDRFGRPTTITDPVGAMTRMDWTVEGKPARRTDPDGAEQTWTYDGEGNCTTHTDANGSTSHFEYTHFDQLAAQTGPDGVRYEFTHDTELRLTQVTNPQNLTWTYTYDPAGRLTAETDFDDRTQTYQHDPTGRLISRTNPLGQTIRYEHDALGRIVRKDADDRITTFEHDLAGRLLRTANPDADIRYHRDRMGRVKSETVNDHVMSHTYDPLGRRTRRITPPGAKSTFGYDTAGRRTTLTTAGRTIAFAHDAAGRETTRHIGDTLTLDQTWDAASRLTAQTLTSTPTAPAAPTARTVQHRAYTYRADGHLTGLDDQLSGARTFDVDAAGRVTAVHARGWTESYAYDDAGNQTHATWPDQHASPDARGDRTYTGTRITRAGAIRYQHDAAGRLTQRQKTRLSKKPDTWHYTWDAEDHLTAVTTPDGTTWRYLYDPLGRRTAKHRLAPDGSIAEQTDFTWDGTTLTEQTTHSPTTPNPVTLTWDHNGLRPLAQTERILSADVPQEVIDERFFAIVTDLIGTPSELIDESGSIAWRTRSTLWGTTTWAAASTTYTPLRFPGQYFDPETGLHYNFHRYYDPETARYATIDPLGLAPAANPATYIHNPHTWTDPLGLGPCIGEPDPASQGGNLSMLADKIAAHGDINNRGIPGVDDLDVPEHLEDLMTNAPGIKMRDTPSGTPRWTWWDDTSGTMLIREGSNGTFMQPGSGYEYFLKQLRE